MGRESGMATGLVLTGAATEEIIRAPALKPDFVFGSIADLPRIQC
jgi:ribonucleotide monophosphatase NagD (HAD superfamily)